MPLKRALNLVTIRNAPLAQKLELVRVAGYDGVGLWLDELDQAAREPDGLSRVRRALEDSGLIAAELCYVGGWMYPEEGQQASVRAQAERAFRAAQSLGCECVVAPVSTDAGDLEQAASDFAALCELAQRYGARVALEFLGGAQQVREVRTAWRIVEDADAPNGGLLIDSFHFHKGGSELADLDPVRGDRVFLVHVSDCPELPRQELEDGDRIFPGTGVLELELIAAALVNKGYRGFFSLELFNQEYWAADPYLIAQEGIHSMKRAGL